MYVRTGGLFDREEVTLAIVCVLGERLLLLVCAYWGLLTGKRLLFFCNLLLDCTGKRLITLTSMVRTRGFTLL